jgi:hypothetical protein
MNPPKIALRMWLMVNCCVNPGCIAGHKLLRIGDVYAIERLGARTEYVWICSTCASGYEVCLDATGAAMVGHRSGEGAQPPNSYARLYLLKRGARGVPLESSALCSADPVIQGSGDWGKYEHNTHF